MNPGPGLLVGVDVGGTFTDVVWSVGGDTQSLKVPTTTRQEEGFLLALDSLSEALGAGAVPRRLVHGTTVATNAVLQETWSPTALLTTEGFRDVLEIGRQDRPSLYDLFVQRRRPIVPRTLRLEVPERLDQRGRVVRPLDQKAVRTLGRALRDAAEVESVAVVLLFSFLNSQHERVVREILEEEGLDIPITLSSEVLPEVREYERTSTTVLSAALRPVVSGYLNRLLAGLGRQASSPELLIMSSSGGVLSAQEAAQFPAGLLLSGPAGGVEGARRVGVAAGLDDMITLDMGGTSADVSLISGGELQRSSDRAVAGHPVRVPAVDVHTVGAGGGSIAWLDEGATLRVGPHSAGAEPGPACYRRGGTSPTVTDAHLALGHLPQGRTLGGLPPLSLAAARRALDSVANPAGMPMEKAAWGILEVVEVTMEQAIRVISVSRGVDPRDFTLLAFGGAGPLHGVTLAAKLGMRKVLFPAHAGTLSALGLMGADLVLTFVRSLVLPWREVGPLLLRRVLDEFRESASQRLVTAGVSREEVRLEVAADIRYRGQGFELTVPLPGAELGQDIARRLAQAFHRTHEELYGYSSPEDPLELVSLRMTAVAATDKPPVPHPPAGGNLRAAALDPREVYFGGEHGWTSCPVFERERLPACARLPAPSVVEGDESTCLIPPGVEASVDAMGNVQVEILTWIR